MIHRTAILVATALVLCADSTSAEPDPIPDSAYLEISAFGDESYRVNISSTKALYQTKPQVAAEWEEISLPPQRVATYFRSLQSIGVFSWREEYRCNMFDGTSWRLEVMGNQRYFVSWGANDFPPRFKELLKLTSDLIGRPVTAAVSACPPEYKK